MVRVLWFLFLGVSSLWSVVAEMKINEVLYRQVSTGSSTEEFIEFYVTKAGDIENYLFTDQDSSTGHFYYFPSQSVQVGDYVILHVGDGTDSSSGNVYHYYMNRSSILNNDADDVLLLKPSSDDTTDIDGTVVNAIPFDFIYYGTSGSGLDKTAPTSANGVSVSWDDAYVGELKNADKGVSISLTPHATDSDASGCWELTTSGNASDNGCTGYVITRDTNNDATFTYSMGEKNMALPKITLDKTSVTTYDPINETNNPKAIPYAIVKYTITGKNEGDGKTDSDTIVIDDVVPENMKICLSTTANCQELTFVDGSVSSELSLGTVEYSNNNGTDFSYTPTADGEGFDEQVTNVRVHLDGAFKESDGTNYPSFDLELYMGVK